MSDTIQYEYPNGLTSMKKNKYHKSFKTDVHAVSTVPGYALCGGLDPVPNITRIWRDVTCPACKERIANLYNKGAFNYDKLPKEVHALAHVCLELAAHIEYEFLSCSNREELISAIYRMRSDIIDKKLEEIELQEYYAKKADNG